MYGLGFDVIVRVIANETKVRTVEAEEEYPYSATDGLGDHPSLGPWLELLS